MFDCLRNLKWGKDSKIDGNGAANRQQVSDWCMSRIARPLSSSLATQDYARLASLFVQSSQLHMNSLLHLRWIQEVFHSPV